MNHFFVEQASQDDDSLISRILSSLILVLTIILPVYPHQLYFLSPPLMLRQQPYPVTIYIEWLLGLLVDISRKKNEDEKMSKLKMSKWEEKSKKILRKKLSRKKTKKKLKTNENK